jgi:preprotein translocase subunit YajC
VEWLFDFLMLAQLGQGGSAPAAAPAAQGAAEQAAQGAQGAAQAAPGAPACGGGDMTTFLLWMVLLFGLMYFLLIRPQRKQRQQHESMLAALKKGDRVVTTGGLLGTVRGIADNVIILEVADGVQVRIRKEHVTGLNVEAAKAAEKEDK